MVEETTKEVIITDPTEFYENRKAQILNLKNDKLNPYIHKYSITHHIDQVLKAFTHQCEAENQFLQDEISSAGRVHNVRKSGKNLIFYDVRSGVDKIQLLSQNGNFKSEEEFEKQCQIKRGDIVGFRGYPGKSKAGEFSIRINHIEILTPTLHMLPTQHFGIKDLETKYRNRYLDLMVNDTSMKTFITRSKIITLIRKILVGEGFIEVETPMIGVQAGGANARPFKTYHNDLDLNMQLRIAPELFLKMLVVGGMDKVFEIGKNFRNEGIDQSHNPEYTACEFYWAYKDFNDLMDFTEKLLSQIVLEIKGTNKFQIKTMKGEIEIDFSTPFKRISVIEEL